MAARSRDALARHPRVPRAAKAAVAAVLAWLAVQPLGGAADEYPYYAPLGAVIAVSATVADSVRASVQGVAAILLGAALAVGAGAVVPTVPGLAVVVFLGTLVAGWWRLGEMGSWAPVSALFVLIIGSSGLAEYVTGYVLLTGLGAAVGVLVNTVFPPMPLAPGDRELTEVREALAAQLDDLAGGLRHEQLPNRSAWLERHHDIRPQARAMGLLVARSAQVRRVNWRARRWQDHADRQAEHARALERLSLVVDDLAGLLVRRENADLATVALGPRLRGPAATAMEAVAGMLRDHDAGDDPPSSKAVDEAERAVERLMDAVTERMRAGSTDVLEAGAIVTALRQLVATA
ncbi:FUSC family protein [Aeromicrobium sp. Sec7.5]|uniref:FUSC family protein n=1 Tax=Aeromicrobium sp. Sec7.5 TaxID=3121276 RepID=UPI002FE4B0DF